MSTRSTTRFSDGAETIAIVYRYHDGYPDGHGRDLRRFLEDVAAQTQDTRYSEPSYLAAKLVVWLAGEAAPYSAPYTLGEGVSAEVRDERRRAWAKDNPLAFTSVGVVTHEPDNVAYIYVVECGNLDAHGRPSLACYKAARLPAWSTWDDKRVTLGEPVDIPPLETPSVIVSVDPGAGGSGGGRTSPQLEPDPLAPMARASEDEAQDRAYELASADVTLPLSFEQADDIAEALEYLAGVDEGEHTDYDNLLRLEAYVRSFTRERAHEQVMEYQLADSKNRPEMRHPHAAEVLEAAEAGDENAVAILAESENAEHASHAEDALETYRKVAGVARGTLDRDTITDLIASLLHLAERRGVMPLDMNDYIAQAFEHYTHDTEEV